MKLGLTALALGLAVPLTAAQPQKSNSRVIVEDGKEMTVTGCIQRNHEGAYMLTNAAGKDGVVGSYILAVSDGEDDLDDLEKHVGHRVEVAGKAADRGKGRIKVETKSEMPRPGGGKAKSESKSELQGDLAGLPYLGIKSFRMLASVCP
jgi:hypothetical protein